MSAIKLIKGDQKYEKNNYKRRQSERKKAKKCRKNIRAIVSKKCKHKNIIITRKSRYIFPEDWDVMIEKEAIDLGKYFIEEEQTSIFCEDCGEYLEW